MSNLIVIPAFTAPIALTAKPKSRTLREHLELFLAANLGQGPGQDTRQLSEVITGICSVLDQLRQLQFPTEDQLRRLVWELRAMVNPIGKKPRTLKLGLLYTFIANCMGYALWTTALVYLTTQGQVQNLRYNWSLDRLLDEIEQSEQMALVRTHDEDDVMLRRWECRDGIYASEVQRWREQYRAALNITASLRVASKFVHPLYAERFFRTTAREVKNAIKNKRFPETYDYQYAMEGNLEIAKRCANLAQVRKTWSRAELVEVLSPYIEDDIHLFYLQTRLSRMSASSHRPAFKFFTRAFGICGVLTVAETEGLFFFCIDEKIQRVISLQSYQHTSTPLTEDGEDED